MVEKKAAVQAKKRSPKRNLLHLWPRSLSQRRRLLELGTTIQTVTKSQLPSPWLNQWKSRNLNLNLRHGMILTMRRTSSLPPKKLKQNP